MPEPKFYFNFQNLPQMMKNERSNSLTDIKSTHLKIVLLLWNSKNFFTLLLGGYNFGSSEQIFNFSTDTENLEPKPIMNIE